MQRDLQKKKRKKQHFKAAAVLTSSKNNPQNCVCPVNFELLKIALFIKHFYYYYYLLNI